MGKGLTVMGKGLIVAILLFAPVLSSWAVEPSEMLDDPVLEQRAREISKGLRCLVCQNQAIDESNAELASDLRIIVRERLVAGDSDEETVNYIVARYGDWVLLNPPFKMTTLALWLGPLGIVGFAGLFYFKFLRRRPDVSAAALPLNEEENSRLEKILEEV